MLVKKLTFRNYVVDSKNSLEPYHPSSLSRFTSGIYRISLRGQQFTREQKGLFCIFLKNYVETRKHSSRIHTAHSSTILGSVLAEEPPPYWGLSWQKTPNPGRDPFIQKATSEGLNRRPHQKAITEGHTRRS